MGAAASVDPNAKLNEAKCKELAGDKFDERKFAEITTANEAQVDETGEKYVTAAQFNAAMGGDAAGAGAGAAGAGAGAAGANVAAADATGAADAAGAADPEADAAKRGAALGAVLSGAGITKVVMIRHANAQPRDPEAAAAAKADSVLAASVLKPDTPFANAWTVGDLTRKLTEKGVEQAGAAKAWLDASKLRAVVCSEATRATATKDIMAPGFSKGDPGCLTLHTLHPSRSGTPNCEKMFDKLGYGTLDRYFADASVEGCEGRGREVFRHYMDKVTGELHELIAAGLATLADDQAGVGDTVAVFGHAVFLNAVSVAIAEAMAIPDAEKLVGTMDLGETQGIMCDSAAQTITLCGA